MYIYFTIIRKFVLQLYQMISINSTSYDLLPLLKNYYSAASVIQTPLNPTLIFNQIGVFSFKLTSIIRQFFVSKRVSDYGGSTVFKI